MKIKQLKPIYIISLLVLLLPLTLALILTGDNIKAIQGAQNVVYPVDLDNNQSVVGFQVEIDYSTSYLTLIDVQATSRLPNAAIVYNDTSPLVRIVVLVNNESDKILAGQGAVLNLIFDVSESAIADNYTMDLSNFVASNISAVALDVSETDGLFEITAPYGFDFLPPIRNFENFTLQGGAALPLKFNISDENGFVSDNSVLVKIYNLSLGIDRTYNASGEGDDFVQIDETAEHYLTIIHTGQLEMPEGGYTIEVYFDNYQVENIGFELVDKSQGIGKGKNT